MKFTLEGFSQEAALSITKKVGDKNLKLDVIDLVLLRWFVDFAPTMKKKIVNDVQYMWVNYQSIVDDLPLLGIEKTSVYRRFKKMCDLEILTHHHDKNGGSFSYYGYGENYIKLIKKDPMTQKFEGYDSKVRTPMTQESDPLRLKSSNKDSSTINNSSTINSFKERNAKERNHITKSQYGNLSYEIVEEKINNLNESEKVKDLIRQIMFVNRTNNNKPITSAVFSLFMQRLAQVSDGNEEIKIKKLEDAVLGGFNMIYLDANDVKNKPTYTKKQKQSNGSSWEEVFSGAMKKAKEIEQLKSAIPAEVIYEQNIPEENEYEELPF